MRVCVQYDRLRDESPEYALLGCHDEQRVVGGGFGSGLYVALCPAVWATTLRGPSLDATGRCFSGGGPALLNGDTDRNGFTDGHEKPRP
jgi:hypothetical protein